MEPCIEIDPSKFVVVVGPRFTSSLISEFVVDDATSRGPPIFAFKEIVNRGIELLLQAESFSSEGDRAKREMLFRNAYELDPTFALRKVADSLKKLGRYSDWLDHLFKRDVGTPAMSRIPGLLRLLDLQRKGALLVYAHCDDILNRLAGLEPILPERKDHASKWSSGEMTGFLHIHGVYSEPDTVKLDCEVLYGNVASEHIRLAFEQRDVVALGLDEHHDDPLLSRFWEKHITPRPAVRQTFFLSSLPPSTVVPPAPSDCLPLALPHPSGYVAGFSDAVCDTAETSWSLCKRLWARGLPAYLHVGDLVRLHATMHVLSCVACPLMFTRIHVPNSIPLLCPYVSSLGQSSRYLSSALPLECEYVTSSHTCVLSLYIKGIAFARICKR